MAHTPNNLSTGGWIRLVIYVVGALIGLAALVAAILGYAELAALMGTIAGGAAAITGGTATFNIEKAPDNKTPVDVREVLPAFLQIMDAAREYREREQPTGDGRDTQTLPRTEPAPVPQPAPETGTPVSLNKLRDIIASNQQG